MTSQRRFIRGYGLVVASALLLGTACNEPQPSGTQAVESPAPTQTQQAQQPLASVRICAYRPNFKSIPTYCSATDDPAVLYEKVLDLIRANCITLAQDPLHPTEAEKARSWENCMSSPPVLWAEATSLEGVASWKEQVARINVFFKTSPSRDVTSKAYELSFKKILETSLQIREAELAEFYGLEKRSTAIINTDLTDILKQKAVEEGKALNAAQADSRESISEIQEIIDRHKAKLETYHATYAALVERFAAYRSTEDTVLARLQQLAQQASSSTLETLPQVQLDLVQLSRTESRAPQEMKLEAYRLSYMLAHEHDVLEQELEPYVSFMRDNTIPRPRPVDDSIHVLQNMVSYADSRYTRTSQIVSKVLTGIRQRQDALSAQRVDEATRKTLVDAAMLEASTRFLAEINTRITEVGKLPARSTRLRLYYMADKLQDHEGILQMQPVCSNVSSTPWMGTGCNILSLQFSKSRAYVTTNIPGTIQLNVAAMRKEGVNATLLQEVEQHLAANRLRAAAMTHDVALRSSENL